MLGPLAAAFVLALSASAQGAQESWDLAQCQRSLTAWTEVAKAGHVCTPEHLEADLAKLGKEVSSAPPTDPPARDSKGISVYPSARPFERLLAETGSVEMAASLDQNAADYAGILAHWAKKFVDQPDGGLSIWFVLLQHFKARRLRLSTLLGAEFDPPEIQFETKPGESAPTLTPRLPETSLPLQGAALLGQCEQFAQATGAASLCVAYIAGVSDTLDAYRPLRCRPEAVTYGQLVNIVVKFLRDHPERLHENRRALVDEALRGAFPCLPPRTSP